MDSRTGTEISLDLYACMTPNTLKVMLMLGELDLPFRLNRVRVYRGENFADGFEALHPYRKLPVLVDHAVGQGKSHTVFESGAILVYLADKAGRLLGSSPPERSTVTQWLMFQMSTVGPVFGNATHFARARPGENSYARRRFITQAIRVCETYDSRLATSPFVAGESYSVADIAAFPWLWRHPGMVGIEPDNYPHVLRWIEEIRGRPAFGPAHDRYRELVRQDRADLATADPEILDRFLGRGRWFLVD